MPLHDLTKRTQTGHSADGASRSSNSGYRERGSSTRDAGPQLVLRVNEESLTAGDLWKFERKELAEARRRAPEEFRGYVERRAAQLIPERITEMLLYQHCALRLPPEAEKRIDAYVDGEIRKIITAQHGGVQRRFERSLAERGLVLDDVRQQLRREIIITNHLDQEVKPKVAEPTRAELLAVFEANRDEWRRPARRAMSVIDIRVADHVPDGVRDPTPEQTTAARAEARSFVQTIEIELRNGADFGEMARRHSDGLHAADGGSWGWVEPGSVRERFEPAVDALQHLEEGQVSPIIDTTDGFFLVRCDQIEPAVEPQFQDVQPALKHRHFQLAYNGLIAQTVDELRRKARVDPPNLEAFHVGAVEAALEATGDAAP